MGDSTTDDTEDRPYGRDNTATLMPRLTTRQIRWLIFLLVLVVITTALVFRDYLANAEDLVSRLGYPAIFTLALVGAGGLVLPLPSTLATFVGGALLNPIYVGLLAGFGEALGEITGYALGYSGQGVVKKGILYNRVERWVRERGGAVIFVFALIPNPVFDVLGIAAGALRYPLRRFLVIAWAGKTTKNIGIAYAGAQGVTWVKDALS